MGVIAVRVARVRIVRRVAIATRAAGRANGRCGFDAGLCAAAA
ncbi:hypothetical protein [Metallibacterium sp.]